MGILNWLFGKKDPPKGSGATAAGATKSEGSESLANDCPEKPAVIVGTMPAADATPEVIRIGASGARIVSVTQKRIEYIDVAGQEQFVDLEECATNWAGWHDNHSQEFLPLPGATEQGITAWNARCVGQRGATDDPPWAEDLRFHLLTIGGSLLLASVCAVAWDFSSLVSFGFHPYAILSVFCSALMLICAAFLAGRPVKSRGFRFGLQAVFIWITFAALFWAFVRVAIDQ
jgi:hypothetical protein